MPVVGIVADSGLPISQARRALEHLGRSVEMIEGTFVASPTGGIDDESLAVARHVAADHGWDRLIYVTDQPLVRGRRPELYRVHDDGAVIVLSISGLGVLRVHRRTTRVLEHCISDADTGEANRTSVLRLMGGLIRANQPGRLLPVLGSVFVAIAATGGFGIFYGSIWNLAVDVSWGRLVGISLTALLVLTAALILSNGLWQRSDQRDPRWLGRMDNVVTFATIFLTAIMVFVLAVAGLTVLTLVIVPPDYLAETISRGSVTLGEYLRIGWFSAALGVLAGAIASNFDRTPEIRSAAYNPREHARRLREDSFGNDSPGKDQ